MTKRRVLTSVVASAVLAGVLALSGCGGSNSGSCCSGGLKSGEEAAGTISSVITGQTNKTVLAGNTGDETNEAGSATVTRTLDSLGNETCQIVSDGCSLTVNLLATCCPDDTTCADRVEADDKYKTADGLAALEEVKNNPSKYDYDITKDMVVYGGTILPVVSGFCTSDLKIDVKGMKCGQAIKLDGLTVATGFANRGHKVFAMITRDGEEPQFTAVGTMDELGNFTIDLTGIDLCGENVEVTLLSIKPARSQEAGTTGATGGSGG